MSRIEFMPVQVETVNPVAVRMRELDRRLGIQGEIPDFHPELKQTVKHEAGHAKLAKAVGITVDHVSAIPDFSANPPHLGVTRFSGKIDLNAFQIVAAGGEAAAGEKGTGGDRMQSAMIDLSKGVNAGFNWRMNVLRAESMLGNTKGPVWDLAARIFLASGGEGSMEKLEMAFERAELELSGALPKILERSNDNRDEESSVKKNKDWKTDVEYGLKNEIRFRQYNLVTGKEEILKYYSCCGGKNMHMPDCEIAKKASKSIEGYISISDRPDNTGIIFEGNPKGVEFKEIGIDTIPSDIVFNRVNLLTSFSRN